MNPNEFDIALQDIAPELQEAPREQQKDSGSRGVPNIVQPTTCKLLGSQLFFDYH